MSLTMNPKYKKGNMVLCVDGEQTQRMLNHVWMVDDILETKGEQILKFNIKRTDEKKYITIACHSNCFVMAT